MSTTPNFVFPVVGVSYRQEAVRRIRPHQEVTLRAQPENPHDANAIAVFSEAGEHLGYVPAKLAPRMARVVEAGARAEVLEVLSGDTWGLRIKVFGTLGEGAVEDGTPRRRREVVTGGTQVMAKSGRVLGAFAGLREGRVRVEMANGEIAEFPEEIVSVS